jgi:predicted AAA+ superfamily ATPase
MSEELIARIAAALDRIAPPPPAPADPQAHPAYLWRQGVLQPARAFEPVSLDLLEGIDPQKEALVGNMRRLAAGLPAHDVLLWGARGTGKSAIVKAGVGAVQGEGGDIALVEIAGDAIASLPALFTAIASVSRAFVLFIDDLGFSEPSEAPRLLRSMLEGGAEARPGNARLHVTSNRRHIVPRSLSENDPINPRDVADDKLALADRFGLSLGFHVVDQPTYLAIIEGYAEAHGLSFDPHEAVAWATLRGARSGRVAWQYVVELAGQQGKRL